MNRVEFLGKLKELLYDIPDNEREEAVEFYNDYFDEAGVENEDKVIRDFGSPEKLAATIKAGLSDKPDENGEYSENGYRDSRFVDRNTLAKKTETSNNSGYYTSGKKYTSTTNSDRTTGKIVLIILLCIFALPVILPVVVGIFGALIGVIAAIIGVAVALVVAGFSVLLAGIALIVAGFVELITAPYAAMCLIGGGFVLTGFSIIGILLMIMVCAAVIPAVVRGFVHICKKPFKRKEKA